MKRGLASGTGTGELATDNVRPRNPGSAQSIESTNDPFCRLLIVIQEVLVSLKNRPVRTTHLSARSLPNGGSPCTHRAAFLHSMPLRALVVQDRASLLRQTKQSVSSRDQCRPTSLPSLSILAFAHALKAINTVSRLRGSPGRGRHTSSYCACIQTLVLQQILLAKRQSYHTRAIAARIVQGRP